MIHVLRLVRHRRPELHHNMPIAPVRGHAEIRGMLEIFVPPASKIEFEILAWRAVQGDAHASLTIDCRDFGMTYPGFAVGKAVTITIDPVGLPRGSDAPAM